MFCFSFYDVVQAVSDDDCHYQGTIRNVEDSSVVLNTCEGLR